MRDGNWRNPLAISMHLRRNGDALDLTREALAAAIPQPGGKLLILAHGLCMNDLQWLRDGHDHGAGARPGLHATLPALQQRPACVRQWACLRRSARSPGQGVAGGGEGGGDHRAQHGRTGGAQRLP